LGLRLRKKVKAGGVSCKSTSSGPISDQKKSGARIPDVYGLIFPTIDREFQERNSPSWKKLGSSRTWGEWSNGCSGICDTRGGIALKRKEETEVSEGRVNGAGRGSKKYLAGRK